MTYEEAIRVAATVLDHPSIYMGGPSGQSIKRATAVFEAVGLNEIMIKAQNWEDSFKDHGVANFDLDDYLEVHAPSEEDSNVVRLQTTTTLDLPVSLVLDKARDADLGRVIVVGRTDAGELYFASSTGSAMSNLWDIEKAKAALMELA